MKKDIHPQYDFIKVIMSDKSEYITRSTYVSQSNTLKLTNDRFNHPAWIKKEEDKKSHGRVSDFKKKFKGFDI